MMQNVGIIEDNTKLFVCDIQEKFRPAIQYFGDVIEVTKRLIQGAKILDIDIVVTEQYPKGLGSTVEELKPWIDGTKIYDKKKFTMCLPEVISDNPNIKSVILCGIEAHVCVLQTAMDLISKGIDVHVVVDAVSSRSMMDRKYAFKRLRQIGCFLTTSESILLQCCKGADHPRFREVQRLIMQSAPTSGLLTWESSSKS